MANTTVNIDIQVQSKSLNELENELAQINQELKEVPIGSKAFKELSTQAQGVTKELDKATEAAKGFTSEEKFRAADGAIVVYRDSNCGSSLASAGYYTNGVEVRYWDSTEFGAGSTCGRAQGGEL